MNKYNKNKIRNLFLFLFFIFFLNIFFDKSESNKDMEIAKLLMDEKNNYSDCFISSIRVSYFLNILEYQGKLNKNTFDIYDCVILEYKHLDVFEGVIKNKFNKTKILKLGDKSHTVILERKI